MHTHLSHSLKDVMKFFCMFLELKDLVTAEAFRVSMPFLQAGTG